MSGNLIISPLNVKFLAPFPHMQRRQLSLLNVNPRPIAYSVLVDAPELLEVRPEFGVIDGFDTIELSILMLPVTENQPKCSFAVKYLVEDYPEETPDWTQALITRVSISVEDTLQYKQRLSEIFRPESNDDEHQRMPVAEPEPERLCHACAMKRLGLTPAKRSCWMLFMLWASWLLFLLSLPLVAYLAWNWRDLVLSFTTKVISY